MIVALEGGDATGKSTLLSGHHDEDTDEFCEGVVERISEKTARKVIPTREPGTISKSGDSQTGWAKTPLMDLEDHLNTTVFWINMARIQMMAEVDEEEIENTGSQPSDAFNALVVASFLAKYADNLTRTPAKVEAVLSNQESWPSAFGGELSKIQDEFSVMLEAIYEDPTLRGRFETYEARDCIRHALIGAADSDSLPPTASGLLFFANHVLHARMIERRSSSTRTEPIFITDRGPDSQRAYGRVRGDSKVVETLYDRHEPYIPDAVVYLYTSTEAIERRLNSRGNGNKSWDDEGFRESLDRAYSDVLGETDAQVVEIDTTDLSPDEMIEQGLNTLVR